MDDQSPLWIKENSGEYRFTRPASERQIIDLAKKITHSRFREWSNPVSSPRLAAEYLEFRYHGLEREVFSVVFLDTRHRVLTIEDLFYGTLTGATVHPREVVKAALSHNAGAVILAHNHPSGVAEPSSSDCSLTRRIREALELVDVRVLDHLVIGEGEFVSMSDRGLI